MGSIKDTPKRRTCVQETSFFSLYNPRLISVSFPCTILSLLSSSGCLLSTLTCLFWSLVFQRFFRTPDSSFCLVPSFLHLNIVIPLTYTTGAITDVSGIIVLLVHIERNRKNVILQSISISKGGSWRCK